MACARVGQLQPSQIAPPYVHHPLVVQSDQPRHHYRHSSRPQLLSTTSEGYSSPVCPHNCHYLRLSNCWRPLSEPAAANGYYIMAPQTPAVVMDKYASMP